MEGERRGGHRGGGGEERQMKFKLAVSPGTKLKQCSERKPKRKKEPRGVCTETHGVSVRVRTRAWKCAKQTYSKERKGWGCKPRVSGAIPWGPSQSRTAWKGRFWGQSHHPSVNTSMSISDQLAKHSCSPLSRVREGKPQGLEAALLALPCPASSKPKGTRKWQARPD